MSSGLSCPGLGSYFLAFTQGSNKGALWEVLLENNCGYVEVNKTMVFSQVRQTQGGVS